MQIVDIGHSFVVLYIEYVHVVDGSAHHLALASVVLQQQILAFDILGLFKAHLFGELLHLRHQFALYLCRVALQYLLGFGYIPQVLFVRLHTHAGCLAVLDMVFQARLVLLFLYAVGRDMLMAASERVQVTYQFQQGIHRGHMAVWAEIGACPRDNLACLEDSGEVFIGDDDAWVGLPILEQDVVSGIPLLDKVVFQQQGIFLGVYHDISDVAYLAHQDGRLSVLMVLREIGVHPSLQVFSLPHIDDGARFIQVLVATRFLGQVEHYPFEIFLQFVLIPYRLCFLHAFPARSIRLL